MKNLILVILTLSFFHTTADAGRLTDLWEAGRKQVERFRGQGDEAPADESMLERMQRERKAREAEEDGVTPDDAGKKADKEDDGRNSNFAGNENSYKGNPLDDYVEVIRKEPDAKGMGQHVRKISKAMRMRKGSAPMLLGGVGVGKSFTWGHVQHLIEVGDRSVGHLQGRTVVNFKVNEFMGEGNQLKGTEDEKIAALIRNLKERDDLIVVFDEFDGLLSTDEGMKLMKALKTVMASGEMKSKIAFNLQEDQFVKLQDPGLVRRLIPITLEEPGEATVRLILEGEARRAKVEYGFDVDRVTMEKIHIVATRFPRNLQAEGNPAFAVKMFDSIMNSAVEELNSGSTRMVKYKEALENVEADIRSINEGIEAGLPQYNGPFFQKRLEENTNLRDRLRTAIDKYDADFAATQKDRDDLVALVEERRGLLAEEENLIKNGTESTDLAELQTYLEELDVDIRQRIEAINKVNSNLVTNKVTDEHLFEGVALVKNMDEKNVAQYIKRTMEDLNVQEDIEALERRVVGQRAAIETIVENRSLRDGAFTQETDSWDTYILLGPSTVGKTELGNAVAERFTFGQKHVIPLGDIGKSEHGLANDLGTDAGIIGSQNEGKFYQRQRETGGIITTISDEADKGPQQFWNFLMEPGRTGKSSSKGLNSKEYDLSPGIHIITSNAIQEITPEVKAQLKKARSFAERQDILKNYVIEYGEKQGHVFPPGALNRTTIIFMDQLEEEHIRHVTKLHIEKKAWINAMQKKHEVGIEIDESVVDWVTQKALAEVGTVKGVKDIINKELAKYIRDTVASSDVKKGDIVRFKIMPDADGNPDLAFGTVPWTKGGREERSLQWDYEKFVAAQTEMAAKASDIVKSPEFLKRLGFPEGVQVDLSGWDPEKLKTLMPYYVRTTEDVENFLLNHGGLKELARSTVVKLGDEFEEGATVTVKLELNATMGEKGQVTGITNKASVQQTYEYFPEGSEEMVTATEQLNVRGEWERIPTEEGALQPPELTTSIYTQPGKDADVWKLVENEELMTEKPLTRAAGESDEIRDEAIRQWKKLADLEEANVDEAQDVLDKDIGDWVN